MLLDARKIDLFICVKRHGVVCAHVNRYVKNMMNKDFGSCHNSFLQGKSLNSLMEYENFVNCQRNKICDVLRSIEIEKVDISNAAIAFYGSFGRGDLSIGSDVDVLVLTKERSWISQLDLVPSNTDVSLKCSVRAIPLDDITPQIVQSLTWAFRFSSAVFVAGNTEIYQIARKRLIDGISSVTLSNLITLFENDCVDRGSFRDPRSPDFYDFKMGLGGFRDFEMSKLIALWYHIHKADRCIRVSKIFKSILHNHRLTAFLRHHLRCEIISSLCSSIQLEGIKYKQYFPKTEWYSSNIFVSPHETLAIRKSISDSINSLLLYKIN